ncbi:8-oxo-dGTP diphosphatase [Candidatus Parcubacteria bacterium]|nr:MAG: 8-oxo-dGTP diphosphatase [Candidatus Parcubacteria bacterium]
MKTTTISFLVDDSRVVLAEKKRGFGQGFLNGYGGKAQEGETPEDAAIRELREEAGVAAAPDALEKVAVIDFFDGKQPVTECHIFFASAWDGEPRETEEMAKPAWFDRANPPFERMWAADRTWLPLVFNGQKIRAKAYYEQGMKKMDRFEHKPLS